MTVAVSLVEEFNNYVLSSIHQMCTSDVTGVNFVTNRCLQMYNLSTNVFVLPLH